MYNAIGAPVKQVRQARIYQRAAVGLLCCLIFVFVYPFYLVISGIDLSAPAVLQTENKTIYYLQWLIPMLCVGIAVILRKSHFLLHLSPALLLYCAHCFLSAAWSEDPYVSLKFAARLSLYVIGIAALCEVLSLETVCRVLMKSIAFIVFASIAMAVLAPGYEAHQTSDAAQSVHAGLWRGVFPHKNELGAMAASATIAFLFFGHLGSSFPGFRVICVVGSLACLVSRVGRSAGVLGRCADHIFRDLGHVALCVALSWLFMFIVAAALAGALLATDVDTFSLLGRDPTMAGRTAIWDVVLTMVADSPLLGHGYYAGTLAFAGPRLKEIFGPAVWDAHNGYLRILLETGIIGLCLYLYTVLSVIFIGTAQARREERGQRDYFMFLLISPILSLVFACFEGPVSEEGCIGTLNFFGLVAIYSHLKQSESRLEVAHEQEAGRDIGVLV